MSYGTGYRMIIIVVVVKRDNSAIEDITLFAYLFSAFLFLVALFRGTALLIWSRLHWSQLKTYWQMNIRSQIHTTIIFISLFSFVVIGVATIIFFINRYNRNNQARLSKAMMVMVSEVQSKLSAPGGYSLGRAALLSGVADGTAGADRGDRAGPWDGYQHL